MKTFLKGKTEEEHNKLKILIKKWENFSNSENNINFHKVFSNVLSNLSKPEEKMELNNIITQIFYEANRISEIKISQLKNFIFFKIYDHKSLEDFNENIIASETDSLINNFCLKILFNKVITYKLKIPSCSICQRKTQSYEDCTKCNGDHVDLVDAFCCITGKGNRTYLCLHCNNGWTEYFD